VCAGALVFAVLSSTVPFETPRAGIGIDISPTGCRVIAKRLRDVCTLPECARPRAQQRGRARRHRIDWSAQQSGHCSGRGRPHSALDL